MSKIKKVWLTLMVLLVAVGTVACSTKKPSSTADNATPKELKVQFVPSVGANKLEDRAKPLEKLLSKRLGIPVHISMSTDYNGLVEAMKSKQVDVGFLPSDGYIMAHQQGAADLLLQAVRYGIKQPGGQATKKLVNSYRGEILVKRGSAIKRWQDLKGKSISVADVTSDSGYVFPVAELKQRGLDIPKSCKVVTVKGADQAVINVLNGDTDAAFTFEDARNNVKEDIPGIMNKVVPIYFTKQIPNDTISVVPSMSKAFRQKLAKAFIAIGKSKEGKAIIEKVYTHEGYVRAKDSDYDIIRKYNKIVSAIRK
ncbi:phosphate/phosphite/phosphonate ABC transporter substrate-binding protein [Lactobacillus xylocopicola]|uniref:Phosphonate ABC transporter substrate-binding protein n=1 Tax=Lactobacillus xylocopicola TaxID=2976676 RepID=A0ABN6SPB5_9LACO|nr:phosphate/phosphite/phosphonate ABC transporter substrate-binding protein [Lactobacillus xylocopicola]BDR61122.1 phosphonate ABC transporter substrate-binding protein [Lactobacillus xylocopicola]